MWRTWRAARLANDLFGTLCCMGVLAMFVFQIFENVGMTMGIMPITGIPLPFISFGGSSLIITMAAVGILLNIAAHERTVPVAVRSRRRPTTTRSSRRSTSCASATRSKPRSATSPPTPPSPS